MAEHKQQSGFTLVEAVVTAAIIALMSALVLTGTSGARDKFQVRNAAQQFANSLYEAILMTKNGVNATGCIPSAPPVPRECSSYTISASLGGNTYDRKVTVSSVDYGVKTSALPGGVAFAFPAGDIKFIFSFPGVATTTQDFTLASKNDPTIQKHVCVTNNGAVSVKDSCP